MARNNQQATNNEQRSLITDQVSQITDHRSLINEDAGQRPAPSFVSSCLRGEPSSSSPLLITHYSLFIEKPARRRAFTLIELLVVMSIIAILIAILVPAVISAQKQAYISATMGDMRTISTGLQAYHVDFNMYPQSGLVSTGAAYQGTIAQGKAYEVLAEALLGYLPGKYDGAPSSNAGANGYTAGSLSQTKGFRVGVSRTVYGPYLDIGASNIVAYKGPYEYYLGDGFPPSAGSLPNPILYFSANTSPSTTAVFSSTAGAGIFNSSDNSASPGLAAPTGGQAAGSAGAAFMSLIGANAGNTNSGSTITGSQNYLLVSAGPDGTFFSGDDIVYGQ